ncbi:M67 family metallopeptidase [Croceibacterium sp. LX-88]|uniref:M67 family metallopeptidase n=1 Tax=Croceibacterium selenioxidans TaxID=2838833 RepID=A0ABS5VZR8_9SPHN|nr:M67 family metallopeptidase [Croceibacterium selenioxidans]MBT2132889.1 M67 family metallopeptidase [Croceibacterium selenioxidans]
MADWSARDTASTGLRISKSALEAMKAQASRATPEECCGLLFGDGSEVETAVPTANVATDRLRFFEIDPQALVDAYRAERSGGPRLCGYFHSHPNGTAVPSPTDRALASADGKVWAIVAGEEVTFWRDLPSGFMRLSYTVNDR